MPDTQHTPGKVWQRNAQGHSGPQQPSPPFPLPISSLLLSLISACLLCPSLSTLSSSLIASNPMTLNTTSTLSAPKCLFPEFQTQYLYSHGPHASQTQHVEKQALGVLLEKPVVQHPTPSTIPGLCPLSKQHQPSTQSLKTEIRSHPLFFPVSHPLRTVRQLALSTLRANYVTLSTALPLHCQHCSPGTTISILDDYDDLPPGLLSCPSPTTPHAAARGSCFLPKSGQRTLLLRTFQWIPLPLE